MRIFFIACLILFFPVKKNGQDTAAIRQLLKSDQSARAIQRLSQSDTGNMNNKQKAAWLSLMGEAQQSIENAPAAFHAWNQAALAIMEDNPNEAAQFLLNAADVKLQEGNMSGLDRWMKYTNLVLSHKVREHLKAGLLQRKRLIHLRNDNMVAADHTLDQLMALDTSQLQPDVRRQLFYEFATVLHSRGQVEEAINWYYALIGQLKASGDSISMIHDLNSLGGLLLDAGRLTEAQEAFTQSLRFAELAEDSLAMAEISLRAGNVYNLLGNYDLARDQLITASILAAKQGMSLMEAQAICDLATMELSFGKDSLATVHAHEAFSRFRALNAWNGQATALYILTQTGQSSVSPDSSLQIVNRALAVGAYEQDNFEMIRLLILKAYVLKDMKVFPRAMNFARQALALANENGSLALQGSSNKALADILESMGQLDTAYMYRSAEYALKEKLAHKRNQQIIHDLSTRYETEKKDRAIAEQKSELAEQTLKLQQRRNQILLLLGGLLLFAVISVSIYLNYRRRKEIHIRDIQLLEKEKETDVLRAIVEGEEQERRRVARELHDGLGALLATVKLRFSAIQRDIPGLQKEESYTRTEHLLDDACQEVRSISHRMMPRALEDGDLDKAVEALCEAARSPDGPEIEYYAIDIPHDLSPDIALHAYRIIQELIKNALQHAKAQEIMVQLQGDDDQLMITLEDDGVGFNTADTGNGLGVSGVGSRVNYLEGDLEIESTPGKGSSFYISLPIK